MAAASIRSSAITSGTTASAAPVITLPATVSAGDTLLVLFRVAVAGAIGWPGAAGVWNELVDASPDGADDQMALAWKKADGTEGGTTITLSCTSGKFAAIAWAIQDAADPTVTPPQLSTVATGTTPTQPNATTVTPTGGSKDYLFGTIFAMEGEQTGVTTYPTNYTLGQRFVDSGTGGAVTTNVTLGGAWRQATAASEDPGAWTVAGTLDDWSTYAIAVHPSNAQSLTGSLISSAVQLFAGVVTVGAVSISGAHIASGAQLYAGSTPQNVSGATITSTAQTFAGVVTGTTNQDVTGATILGPHAWDDGAWDADAWDADAWAAQTFAGTVSLGASNVTGSSIASTLQTYAGTVGVGSVNITGSLIASTVQTYAGTVSHAGAGTAIGTVWADDTWDLDTWDVDTWADVDSGTSVTGATLASTAQLFAGTVTTGAVNVSGAHVASTAVVYPGTAAQGGVFVDGSTITSTTQTFAGTVTTGAVNVVGSHIATTRQLFAGTVTPPAQDITGATKASTAGLFGGTVTVGAASVDGAAIPSSTQLFSGSVLASQDITGATIASTAQLFPGREGGPQPAYLTSFERVDAVGRFISAGSGGRFIRVTR